MRILKKKIEAAQRWQKSFMQPKGSEEVPDYNSQIEQAITEPTVEVIIKPTNSDSISNHQYNKNKPSSSSSCNNIMKNYCRALTNFALSPIALPYLSKALQTEKIHMKDYRQFVEVRQPKVNCILRLREM